MATRKFDLIENYIYLYHLKQFVIIPTFPESINDSMSANFASTAMLSRSAPVFSYSNSGPRTLQIDLHLHRDLMYDLNYQKSNLAITLDDDYIDTLIKNLQAIAVPEYEASSKMVNPPMVAVRFGDDIFCKGVVTGSIGVSYRLPLLANNKYAQVDLSFAVSEVDPFSASTIAQQGSFRGLDTTLERNLYKRR